jgi:hypothetical protein
VKLAPNLYLLPISRKKLSPVLIGRWNMHACLYMTPPPVRVPTCGIRRTGLQSRWKERTLSNSPRRPSVWWVASGQLQGAGDCCATWHVRSHAHPSYALMRTCAFFASGVLLALATCRTHLVLDLLVMIGEQLLSTGVVLPRLFPSRARS